MYVLDYTFFDSSLIIKHNQHINKMNICYFGNSKYSSFRMYLVICKLIHLFSTQIRTKNDTKSLEAIAIIQKISNSRNNPINNYFTKNGGNMKGESDNYIIDGWMNLLQSYI